MSEELWERLWDEGETDKAWVAFEIYRDLPIHHKHPEKRRSQANVAREIGHNSMTMVNEWSSKYRWVERSRAYDTYKSKLQMTVREKSLEDYQQHVYTTEGLELGLLEEALHTKIKQTLDQLRTEDVIVIDEKTGKVVQVEPIDLLRLTTATEKLANMRRRLGQLAVTYKSDTAEKEQEDGVYLITAD